MSQPPPFLSLPGEIRNQIYTHLFTLPSPSASRILGYPTLYPALLSTCTQIHKEGIQILYGTNTFLAHPNLLSGLPRLRLYYSTISSPSLIALITRYHIHVRLDCDPNFSREKAKEAFSGMEELTIEVFQAQYGSSDYKVLRLFEGVRGVKRVRVYGSITGFPEYVQWLQDSMMAGEGETRQFETRDGESAVRKYDLWIVGETMGGNESRADWCL
jgi:hypothetical protein